ncbi:unnamed protein product [Rhizoctonia solani]|uniref:Uncharacterized protein n=1 Tax=Rhizoctonia solani TaxID=456999 RepID=A0A8H2XB07_9AGAM|nr:unnamed protein product [Rhizoctonia solani]
MPFGNAPFSPNSTHLATCEWHNIYIRNIPSGEPVLCLPTGHTSSLNSIAFSPQGTCVASASDDATIRICSVRLSESSDNTSNSDTTTKWQLRPDGWVIGSDSELLLWVPPDLHASLLWPSNTTLFSTNGYVRLNFDGARIGEEWANSYEPANS